MVVIPNGKDLDRLMLENGMGFDTLRCEIHVQDFSGTLRFEICPQDFLALSALVESR